MKNAWFGFKAVCTPSLLLTILIAICLILCNGARSRVDNEMTRLEISTSEIIGSIVGVEEAKVIIRTRTIQNQSETYWGRSKMEEIPCGALAAIKGEENPFVQMKITQALCAVLGLHQSEVDVIFLKNGVE